MFGFAFGALSFINFLWLTAIGDKLNVFSNGSSKDWITNLICSLVVSISIGIAAQEGLKEVIKKYRP